MKLIPLTRGLFAKVDDEDYEYLSQFNWHANLNNGGFYAVRTIRLESGKRTRLAMHRHLLNLTDKNYQVDHKDRDTLNNQKYNLRKCTVRENNKNRNSSKGSTSKYLGVHLKECKKTYMTKRGMVTNIKMRYVTKIQTTEKELYLGSFEHSIEGEIEAAKAYDKAAKIHHGEFANLNFKD